MSQQKLGAGRENRTLTQSLARTEATFTSYPQLRQTGWLTWARTRDILINSQTLYRLSYKPISFGGGWENRTPINSLQSCRNPIILIPQNALRTPAVIISHQKFGQQVLSHRLVFHHARPPPAPRQVPFSYCQR